MYFKDGVILRKEQVNETKKIQLLNNLEQIKYLSWQFQNGLKKKKNGQSIAFWDGKALNKTGGYYQDDLKQGLWKELIKNYWKKAQIFETGEYQNDLKIGKWNYIYENNKIDGGLYRGKGQKKGKWTELDDRFWDYSQVIYKGEYNIKGIKVGLWDILYCNINQKKLKLIGGGLYDSSQGIKIGKWIELDKGFYLEKQITYVGEYNMKGIKFGRWDILYCNFWEKNYQLIAGGSYDNAKGNKIGKWIELDKEFYFEKQVTFNGEYNINGMKVGRWNTVAWDQQIGGGSYDISSEIKIGQWVELDEGFRDWNQVTYSGEYNIKGNKVGTWVGFNIVFNKKGKEIIYDT
ncbi:unnamed protein product [Paramecium sonneborni]|nr:unnamed protein product [Paramecium sonneborni]